MRNRIKTKNKSKCRNCDNLGDQIYELINYCKVKKHGVRYYKESDCSDFKLKKW